MLNVVATDGMDKEAQEVLGKHPRVRLQVKSGVPAAEVVAALKEADLAVIRSATNLTAAVLNQLPNLKGVVRAGVGLDNIDSKAAEELGIWVWNAPTGNFQSTAELAIGLTFAAARRIAWATEGARSGAWYKKEISAAGRQISGSTFGIFGAGNIGMRVAKMAAGIGARVQICDPVYQSKDPQDFPKVDFDTLLATSDFITMHAPLLPSTKHAFNEAAFAKIKTGCILVNAARGGLIDEKALLAALKAGKLGGVGLDVFETEPFTADHPVYGELLKDPRVVATPHIGASTVEAAKQVGLEVAEKIGLLADGRAPKPLNAPKSPRLAI
jgi:D-3-phosphoglycerate dehydrogenase